MAISARRAAHGQPVGHGSANRAINALERKFQRIPFTSAETLGNLDMEIALALDRRHFPARRAAEQALQLAVTAARHREDRMRHKPKGQAAFAEFRKRGIEQERHVIVQDLDDRARAADRIEHRNLGDAGLALRDMLGGPLADGEPGGIAKGARILAVHAGENQPCKGFTQAGGIRGKIDHAAQIVRHG